MCRACRQKTTDCKFNEIFDGVVRGFEILAASRLLFSFCCFCLFGLLLELRQIVQRSINLYDVTVSLELIQGDKNSSSC
jgi:hypothetical protein